MNMMKHHPSYSNLLQFDKLSQINEIAHFSTTRVGGVSNGSYSSFNMGNFSDDSPLNIYENRKILAQMFYMNMSDFIVPHQTHGTRVLKIDEKFLNLDHTTSIEIMYGVDSVITNITDKFLCVTTADCVPIIIYDLKSEAIAAIHAGWKGTSGKIVEKTISAMINEYNSSPQDMIVGIGPAISQQNYEVGGEVIEKMEANGIDLSDDKVCIRKPHSPKGHINLKEINRRELINLGVSEANIETTDLCTFDKQELFFSARRQTVHSGRMLTGIMLKS
ncbi:MAG TPA: peptidoglycan editing factor PgeF [Bacteroidales bacterium]|nr:peptidoglycan editing factor PgeF [Bacteroidales bacterium]